MVPILEDPILALTFGSHSIHYTGQYSSLQDPTRTGLTG